MEFNELLEHLDDLIALADNEGFALLSVSLMGVRVRALNRKEVYAERRAPASPAAPTDADAEAARRFPRNVRDL